MYDVVISVSLVVLMISIVFYMYERARNRGARLDCGTCKTCEEMCSLESRQKVNAKSHMNLFDKLKGKCALISGNLISTPLPKLTTSEQCASTCALDNTCLGFNFDKRCEIISTQKGALTERLGSDRSKPGDCFIKRIEIKRPKKGRYLDLGPGECVHVDDEGEDFDPVEQIEKTAPNVDACASLCDKSNQCTSFSYDSLTNTCLLNTSSHETRGAHDYHATQRCYGKKNARTQIAGYDDEPGECLGKGNRAKRLQLLGRYDATTPMKCSRLCNEENDCIGFTFDKREGKGCQLIFGKDNKQAELEGLLGSKLQAEAFSCYIRKRTLKKNEQENLDRMTKVLRAADISVSESTGKGKILIIDDGVTSHVASTFCNEGDACVDRSKPELGCAVYSKSQNSYFNEELTNIIAQTKLCFRSQHKDEGENVYAEPESFRNTLDKDRIDTNPVLLGQAYTKKMGRVEGDVLESHDAFDDAVQKCNSEQDCTHLAIYSPYNVLSFKNGEILADESKYEKFRLKRNGFMENLTGTFDCAPQRRFESGSNAEEFCKADAACTGYDMQHRTYNCEFKDAPIVLEKK